MRAGLARGVAATRGARPGRPSRRCSGRRCASRRWPAPSTGTRRRGAPRWWCRRPCRSATSSGSPCPSPLRRGCWPTGVPTGSTASSPPRSAWRPRHRPTARACWRSSGTWRSFTTCPDWSTCPTSGARSSSWTTAAAGSSPSCRRRPVWTTERFEELFGTPPASDVGAVARGFGLDVQEVTTFGALDEALEVPSPGVVRVRVPDRQQNVALHGAIEEAVRRALA